MIRNRFLRAVLQLTLAAACMYWAFKDVDPASVLQHLAALTFWEVSGILTLFTLGIVAPAIRLNYITDGRSGFVVGFKAHGLGLGVNLLLPAKLGEAARLMFLQRHSGMPWDELIGRAFWERFLDLNMLLLLCTVAFFWEIPGPAGALLTGVVLCGWCMLALLKAKPALMIKTVSLVPGQKPRTFLQSAAQKFETTFKKAFLFRLLARTVLVWMTYAFSVIGSLHLVGISLEPGASLVFFIATAGAMAIPSVPGAIGVYEAMVVAVLAQYGIARDAALSAAITMHILQFVPGLAVTLWVLLRHGAVLPGRSASPREN